MKYSRGFTLIELLVVVAIIGILASIIIASLNIARTKGQDAARKSDVSSIETALNMYYNDNGGFPTSAGSSNGDVLLSDATLTSKLVPKYITSIPALLVSDQDHYYTGGITTGVAGNYDMLIYQGVSNNYCRTGMPSWTGDWGIPLLCGF